VAYLVIQENGVECAIQTIYRDLEYARTLTGQRSSISSTSVTLTGSDEPVLNDDGLEDIEETWTFVDDDIDHKMGRDNGDQEMVGKLSTESSGMTVIDDAKA
jgi:sterol 3beta-glucosyltransferase